MIIKRGDKRAILELSSSSVKLLIGPSGTPRGMNSFSSISEKTSTTEGLQGGRMNIDWYKSHVLPEIIKFRDYCDRSGVSQIECIATAVYRKSENRDDIFNLIKDTVDINPILASGEFEASLAPLGFVSTSKIDGWKLFIDQGRGSTELTLMNPMNTVVTSYSIPYGNADLRAAGDIKKFVSNILSNDNKVKQVLSMAEKKIQKT